MSTFFRIILAATAILMAVIGLAYAQSSPCMSSRMWR
jgi:hypothetical protein